MCLVSVSLLFHFYFCFFRDEGATAGIFILVPNGFLLCDHGLDFLDRPSFMGNENENRSAEN